jgi:NTE family protein
MTGRALARRRSPSRQRVCEHAYERTRLDLARRRAELEPIFSRHGIRTRREAREDSPGGLRLRRKPLSTAQELRASAGELRDALVDLRRYVDAKRREDHQKMPV